ncbi:carboxymuconolactone decarboxylase family protein [Mesorhizobium sp. M0621]|uniref:carboxymuconolactone decarboxylase family protein n=1 Tax=Mesorhizobium sp. M0621 TaxID=2956974 RepID=UPI003335616C
MALRLHLAGALSNGVTREEIIDIFIQLSVYSGFPAALNAFSVARSVLALGVQPLQVDIPTPVVTENRTDRLERGKALLAKSSAASGSGDAVVRSFDDIALDLWRMIVEHSYGEIFSRKGFLDRISRAAAIAHFEHEDLIQYVLHIWSARWSATAAVAYQCSKGPCADIRHSGTRSTGSDVLFGKAIANAVLYSFSVHRARFEPKLCVQISLKSGLLAKRTVSFRPNAVIPEWLRTGRSCCEGGIEVS